MRKIFLLLLIAPVTVLFSCRKQHGDCNKQCEEVTGTVSDLTGKLDGCGIVIVLANGSKLEPVQSPAGFVYSDGKKVSFCYEVKVTGSVCMAGQTVIVKSIRYLP